MFATGSQLKKIRQNMGVSRQALADAAGVSVDAICELEAFWGAQITGMERERETVTSYLESMGARFFGDREMLHGPTVKGPVCVRVYVFVVTSGPLKIGVSRDVAQRLAALRYETRRDLSVAFTARVDRSYGFKVERDTHLRLSDYWGAGEWFYVKPRVAADAIVECAAEMGIELQDVRPSPEDIPHRVAVVGGKVLARRDALAWREANPMHAWGDPTYMRRPAEREAWMAASAS